MKTLVGGCVVAWLASSVAAAPPVMEVAVQTPMIEILDPTGAVAEGAVREAIARLDPELVRCAAGADWQGDALAWLVVDWHGKVNKLELAVDKPAVEACLGATLRKLAVANAQARATIVLRLRIGATSHKRDPAPLPADQPRLPPQQGVQTLVTPGAEFKDPKAVRASVDAQRAAVDKCYRRALAKQPGLIARGTMELDVTESGAVAKVTGTIGELTDCVIAALAKLQLPPPGKPAKVSVYLEMRP